jgi:membrane protease YdiL (CAAX protease family)
MQHICIVSLVVAGVLLFAVFIHSPQPYKSIAFISLAGSGFMIGYSVRQGPLLPAFGLSGITRKSILFCLPALVLGSGLAILTRYTFDLSVLPLSLRSFVFIAPLVGATEELIFRGYIQGQLHSIGHLFSIIYASSVHTCYKLLVILSLAVPLQFDFFFLILWTFLGGIVFGILKDLSKSSLPPMIAHAVFDIVLYGGLSVAPVWVWS